MLKKCCVPGCTSNYKTEVTYTPAFLFPKGVESRKKWIAAINKEDFIPGSTAVVCALHFDERFLIKGDKIQQKDGSFLTVLRKKWMLTQVAYLSIFPNQPFYLSKHLGERRKSPSKRRETLLKRDEENFQNWCEADLIKTFEDIKFTAPKKLSDLYMFKLTDSSMYIYKIEYLECPEITVSLEILKDLTVKLYFKRQHLDSKSVLSFILGKELKLDRWTKFESVLSFLNSFTLKEMTQSQKINSILLILNEIIDSEEIEAVKIKFIKEQLSLINSKQHRYSSEIILWATHLYFSYLAAYMMIRKSGIMTLPHQSYIRNLTSVSNFSYVMFKIYVTD